MFALIENGVITNIVAAIPPAPDPPPEDYVAPDYRPVVDGSTPALTTAFSSIVERPIAEWTIQTAQVVREFAEYIPPIADCRAIKRAREVLSNNTTLSPGIQVTHAPYGTITFAASAVDELIRYVILSDLMIRNDNAAQNSDMELMLIDGSLLTVKCRETGPIVRKFLTEYRTNQAAQAVKLHAVNNAADIAALNAI